MRALQKAFGRKLPLAVIFRSTTPRALALEVDRSAGSEPAPRVIELEGIGDEPPFFMVNAFTGLVEVAKRLDSGHPILSLIGDNERALSGNYDLYEEAYEHVRTILATRPHGPYMVGGWSAGGIMAYEIAQQLESLGHHVALLVLFDTSNPFFMREYSKIETFRARIVDSMRYHRANLSQDGFRSDARLHSVASLAPALVQPSCLANRYPASAIAPTTPAKSQSREPAQTRGV